jgi:hypothetical protein
MSLSRMSRGGDRRPSLREPFERKAGALADALDQSINSVRREWGAALGFEHVTTAGVTLQLAKRAQLVDADRVGGWLAILDAANVQRGGAFKFDLGPFQIAQLSRPKSVTVGHEDQCCVSMPMAALAGGFDKSFDLGWRQVFPQGDRPARVRRSSATHTAASGSSTMNLLRHLRCG